MFKIRSEAEDEVGIDDSMELLNMVIRKISESKESHPVIVEIEAENGNCLGYGECSRGAILTFINANGDPPYFISEGFDLIDTEPVIFSYMGEPSEYKRKNLITIDSSRAALTQFSNNGERPLGIKWSIV